MRLSKTQTEVIWRLQEGWAMRTSWDFVGNTGDRNTKCLQKNGHGRGGPTFRDFTIATVYALRKKGLIKHTKGKHPRESYWLLTDKGKEFEISGRGEHE